MINHYLLTLTPDQEHRVLTEHMTPFPHSRWNDIDRCLVMVVHDIPCGSSLSDTTAINHLWPRDRGLAGDCSQCVTTQYDRLCARFGLHRINAALRTRILSNQARRTLQRDAVPAMEAV